MGTKLDAICDLVSEIEIGEDVAIRLHDLMAEYESSYPTTFRHLMRVPAFEKLWSAMGDMASSSAMGDLSVRQELEDVVTAVRDVAGKYLPHGSHFHLAPCGGCGLPAFAQPCAICGYYPYASRPETLGPFRQLDGRLFCQAVERSGVGGTGGNVGTWLAESYRRTLAPYLADRMKPEMQALSLPSAEDVLLMVRAAAKKTKS